MKSIGQPLISLCSGTRDQVAGVGNVEPEKSIRNLKSES